MKNDEKGMSGAGNIIVGVCLIFMITIVLAGVMYTWTSGLASTDEGAVEVNDDREGNGEPTRRPYDHNRPTTLAADTSDGTSEGMYFHDYGMTTFISTEEQPLSTFAMDVDTASYTLSRAYIGRGELPPSEAIRSEEFINYFDHDYVSSNETFTINVEGSRSPFDDGRTHILKIGIQARELPSEERVDAHLTFVIDVSGSMAREDRLGLVKESLGILMDELKEGDKVGLVTYGSVGMRVLDHTNNIDAIEEAVMALETDGSTNVYEGLQFGYQMATENFHEEKINRIILCSDGVANTGPTDWEVILEDVRQKANQRITLSTIGFGMGNYNDVLMEQLADNGDGNYHYIDDIQEAQRLFDNGAISLLEVVAFDAKVQVEFDPNTVDSYRLIGYENRYLESDDFRNDRIDGGEVGPGHSVTALYVLRLNERGGDAGTINVRYKDAETREVEEISLVFPSYSLDVPFKDASPRFRFTVAVAQFAQILGDSYFVEDGTMEDVESISKDALGDMEDDGKDTEKDHEFLEMVETARNL